LPAGEITAPRAGVLSLLSAVRCTNEGLSYGDAMMVSCRNGIIAAVALIGLITLDAASHANAGDETTNAAYCHWY
jgi:hypothetical protein